MIEALQYALAVSDARYFVHLAGTDLPIQSPKAITDFLTAHHPANFLSYHPLVPGVPAMRYIEKYYLRDLKASVADIRNSKVYQNPRGITILGKLVGAGERALNICFGPRKTDFTRFYCGSSRWCLNRETAQFIVDYYRASDSKQLRRYLRLSCNSDEIFVQTVVLNSVHKHQCFGFDEAETERIFEHRQPSLKDEKRLNLHYVDWSPFREDPAILVEADFERLKNSGKLFAYKFMDDRSLRLVEMIERELIAV